jgi:beta-RFAP synthase
MSRHVVVRAANRLHFGLFALAAPTDAVEQRSYGGVGVMVDSPLSLELHLEAANGIFVPQNPHAERIGTFAQRWAEFYSRPLEGVRIFLGSHTPDHIGLGTGTQLGLSVAAGLAVFYGMPVPPIEELVRSVGRGFRSAVGAYGFSLGGLIVDRGKLPGEFLAPLDCRLELPEEWRFLLVRPLQGAGLAGEREQAAMDQANRNLRPLTEQLVTEAREHLIPAAATGHFANFAASLGRYCETAGQFYADVQGGPFNGPQVTALAKRIRDFGYFGLGQSSWGPTLFVACENETAAQLLANKLRASEAATAIEYTIARVCNSPACITLT